MDNRESGVRKEVSFDEQISRFDFADLCRMKCILCQSFLTPDSVNSDSVSDCLIGEQSKTKYKIVRKKHTVNTQGIKKKKFIGDLCTNEGI